MIYFWIYCCEKEAVAYCELKKDDLFVTFILHIQSKKVSLLDLHLVNISNTGNRLLILII